MTGRNIREYNAEIVELHVHNAEIWIPASLTAAPFAVSTNGADTFGVWVQILNPTPGAFSDFHRFIIVNPLGSALPADGVYHIEIGIGAPGAQVTKTSMRLYIDTAIGNNFPREPLVVICPRIEAGQIAWARVKTNLVPVQTLQLMFGYHVYDK